MPPHPTPPLSSETSSPHNPSPHASQSIEAERDQALREQGRLLAQIEEISLRLQHAERTSQHARLGWIWMSLLLLFGVSGYWRGYMNASPPSLGTPETNGTTDPSDPSTSTTSPSPRSRLASPSTSSTPSLGASPSQPPSSRSLFAKTSEPSSDPTTPQTHPNHAAQPNPSPIDPSSPNHRTNPTNTTQTPDPSCPEGSRYRCLRPCLVRDARKRCIQQAPQPICKCWHTPKQPSIRILSLQSNGPIATPRLQTAARQRMPFFTRCYRNLRTIRPQPPEGEITLRYTIPSFGRPQQVEVESATLQHPSLHTCLIQQIQRMRFRPSAQTASTTASLRLALHFRQPSLPSASKTHPSHTNLPSHRPPTPANPSPTATQPPQPCPTGQVWRCAKPCYQYDEKGQCLAPGPRIKCRCIRPTQRP